MVGSVQDQVLAHNGQTNEAKISTGFGLRRSADIDAGETRTMVSITFLSIRCAMIKETEGLYCKRFSRQLWKGALCGFFRAGFERLE